MDRLGSSAPTNNANLWEFDVFLSFRGQDTRRNFIDHLYGAFKDAGIRTFRDDHLRRGEFINLGLIEAIRRSRICIVVFSEQYADSKWCLNELAEIVHCRKTSKQLQLLPVFYNVQPSDVRKQSSSFGEAFTKHQREFPGEVDRWRLALTEAGNLSGWDLTSSSDGEGKFIKDIVGHISKVVKPANLNVAIYPVGIEARVKKLRSWMSVGADVKTRILGICGMGGSGKTTLSKALYNQYCNSFEGHSFLANVRENSNASNGLLHLQKQLVSDVSKTSMITEINNVDAGVNIIKEMLSQKRVLLVLDDVDNMDQVNALARQRDGFGSGSRIIITTRYKHLLGVLNVDQVYMADDNLLDQDESLELFSWHAFQAPKPIPEFIEYSKDVISYCGSLPLALEVLGSFLYGRSISEWESVMKKLEMIPHRDVIKKLRLSFDALNDDTEKNIFLDVSCFFVGMKKNLVVKILDGCDFFGESGLCVLISRCLVKIDDKGCLTMHDLLRDMGREIVREESPNQPGKRTRLWRKNDIIEVLRSNTGSQSIEGLSLERYNNEQFNTKAFRKMRNLRLLKLSGTYFAGTWNHLTSKELRWIYIEGIKGSPLEVFLNNLYLEKVVVIEMRRSHLKEFWKGSQCLGCLKVLDLSYSNMLIELSNFSKLPNLEELRLRECTSLAKLDNSICELKSLQFLNLGRCNMLDKLPEELGELKSLKTLILDWSAEIGRIPNSIVRCEKLERLSLFGVGLTDEDIPMDFGSLSFLKVLDLGGNRFQHFRHNISNLSKLVWLNFDGCYKLASVSNLPTNLKLFSALRCISLERIPDLSKLKQPLEKLDLEDCPKIVEVPGLLERLGGEVTLAGCYKLSNICRLNLIKKWMEVDHGTLVLSKVNIDLCEFFNFISCGPSLSFQIAPVNHRIRRLELCVSVVKLMSPYLLTVILTNKSKGHSRDWDFSFNFLYVADELIYMVKIDDCSTLELDVGDDVEVMVKCMDTTIQELGCSIVYENYDGIYIEWPTAKKRSFNFNEYMNSREENSVANGSEDDVGCSIVHDYYDEFWPTARKGGVNDMRSREKNSVANGSEDNYYYFYDMFFDWTPVRKRRFSDMSSRWENSVANGFELEDDERCCIC